MKTIEQADAISAEERELLIKIKRAVRGFQPTATVLLYGSVARGTQGPESDYDVLVLTDERLAIREQNVIRDAIFDLEIARDVVICTAFYANSDWDGPPTSGSPFHESVERDAIVL